MNKKHEQEVHIDQERLRQAQMFADAGDAMSMFKLIASSKLLEGLKIKFATRYKRLDKSIIVDEIGSAVDELYDRINKGERIRKIEGYLWTVTERKLATHLEERKKFSDQEVERLRLKDTPVVPDRVLEEQERMEKQRREMAITLAESLIPRLRSPNVQGVMRYILGALRNGAQHITNGEIAEALGLDEGNVRVWKSRGFEKLERIAKEENLIEKSHAFTFQEEVDYDDHDEEGDPYDSDK